MSRASVRVTKRRTTRVVRTKVKKKKGNPNHCPVCGKFMSNRKGNNG